MLSVASSFFGKSSTLSAYNLQSAGPSPSSSSTNLAGTASGRASPAPGGRKSFTVGLWRVVPATHKTTGKDVSVWIFDKKVLDGVRSGRDWVLEQLKKEATSLSRLRHPDILHMVEPLEESRSEFTFVTETVTSSLGNILASASSSRGEAGVVDLDEVEIQKGTLQIAKGLAFIHQQAKSVHLNLNPDAILINSKGDWKLSGLNFITPLQQPDGSASKATYPDVDTRMPPQVQWKLDYLAPEYVLDSQLSPSNDLYSLGCVLFAVHMGGKPPFANRNSPRTLEQNVSSGLSRREYARGTRWDNSSSELKDLLPRLLTRNAQGRMSLQSLNNHPFFSSLAISTLNFLEATSFASKPREEKATFLRGLVRVLPTFSERLKKGKILLSLLEEMKDPYLLPFLLPNVFEISKSLSKDEFAQVLPKIQPLFVLKEPPQNMLTLLENLSLFEEKTTPQVFRENVMPLIYNSLESDHLAIQEKVLTLVPHLCDILDYGTIQNVLLVKLAILFTHTRILTVKVQTLDCFTAMVPILDTTTLTTKMVPLLSKIKTKEPAVMVATLSVHEAMGAKVSLEAIATLVLPQLWAMSMGPLLNSEQFARFMQVIKSLGARVEKEHSQHLREVRKMEEQTANLGNGLSNGSNPFDASNQGEVDFESLVKGGGSSSVTNTAAAPPASDPWEEGWPDMSSANDLDAKLSSAFPGLNFSTSSTPAATAPPSLSTSRNPSYTSSKLKAKAVSPSTFNRSLFETPSPPPQPRRTSMNTSQPKASSPSFVPLQPSHKTTPQSPPRSSTSTFSGPNYTIDLPAQQPVPKITSPTFPSFGAPLQPTRSPKQASGAVGGMGSNLGSMNSTNKGGMGGMSSMGGLGMGMASPMVASPPTSAPIQPAQSGPRPPPGYTSGLMQPTAAPKPAWGSGATGNTDWGDFDPLK